MSESEQVGSFQAGDASQEKDYGYRDQEGYTDEQPGGWGPEDQGNRPGVPLGREDQQPPPEEAEEKSGDR